MRSRRPANDQVAEVARRRLELLSAELAEIRPDPVGPPFPAARDGSGEPSVETPSATQTAPAGPGAGRHAHRPVGLGASLAGWTQDRLPPTLQGRVRLSVGHLVVVALAVLAAAGVSAWWVSRASGGVTALPPVASPPSAPALTTGPASVPALTTASAPVTSGTSTGAPPPTPSPSSTGTVVVDVTGKVRHPGVATLPLGSRVVDALKAAGGARRGVALTSLNLARVLADGEQIVVGVRGPPGVSASAASVPTSGAGSATPMVNINSATQAELEKLPGIGPVTARSILDYRAQKGTFTSVDELLEVSGIGDATLAKIAPYVTL